MSAAPVLSHASAAAFRVDGRRKSAKLRKATRDRLLALALDRGMPEALADEIATRAASLSVVVALLESKLLSGEETDIDVYVRASGKLNQQLTLLSGGDEKPAADPDAALAAFRARQAAAE